MSTAKGVKRSALWRHYTELPDGERANCDYCRSNISFKGGALSNLKKHLKAKHPNALKDLEPTETFVAKSLKSEEADEFAVSTILRNGTSAVDDDAEKPTYSIEVKNLSNMNKRSVVWTHYSISPKFPNKANCDYCRSYLSFKGGSTANLRKHLRAKHPQVYEDIAKEQQNHVEEFNIAAEPEENDIAVEPDEESPCYSHYTSEPKRKSGKKRKIFESQTVDDDPNVSFKEFSAKENSNAVFTKFIISELNLLKDPLIILETKFKIQESIMVGRKQQLSITKNKPLYVSMMTPDHSQTEPSLPHVASYIIANNEPAAEI